MAYGENKNCKITGFHSRPFHSLVVVVVVLPGHDRVRLSLRTPLALEPRFTNLSPAPVPGPGI